MTPGPTIGVDVGGTTTEVVRLDGGAVTEVRTTSTTVDPAGLGVGIVAAIAELLGPTEVPRRIGIGLPGQVDPVLAAVSGGPSPGTSPTCSRC